MIKELKVYPVPACANCSPLVVGDLVFVVTGNGVDDEHRQAAQPRRPRASSPSTRNRQGGLAETTLPGENIMDGQWSNPAAAEVNGKHAGHLPRRRRLAVRLRGQDRQAALEVRLQPQEGRVYKPGGRGDRNYFIATPVVYDNKV